MTQKQPDEQPQIEQSLVEDKQDLPETLEGYRNETREKCETAKNRVINEVTTAIFELTEKVTEDENELADIYLHTFGDGSYSDKVSKTSQEAYRKGEEYFSAKQLAAFKIDAETAVQVFGELGKEISGDFLSKNFDDIAAATNARDKVTKEIHQTFDHLENLVEKIKETRGEYLKLGIDALPTEKDGSWGAGKIETFTLDAESANKRMGKRETSFLGDITHWRKELIQTAVGPYLDTFLPQEKQ